MTRAVPGGGDRASVGFFARVIATYGRSSLIEDGAGQTWTATRRGKRSDIVVGDRVRALAQASGQATIEAVEPRTSLLYRADAHRTQELAANIDQILVVYAARPTFNRWFIWKSLVAASAAGIRARIVQNKTDLADAAATHVREQLAQLGWATHSVSATTEPERTRAEIMAIAAGLNTLLVGQSGMGKSTLLNLLVSDANARTQEYSRHLNVGKQTTSASRWFALQDGGAVVDAPGFHEFGLAHLTLGEIAATFPEFQPWLGHCRFADCRHLAEPGCELIAALERGEIAADRYHFYRALAQ
jgi:ribosome biogenesis GTPase / thiamine phosphate phosphatase